MSADTPRKGTLLHAIAGGASRVDQPHARAVVERSQAAARAPDEAAAARGGGQRPRGTSLETIPDDSLLALARDGQRRAWEALYRRHFDAIFRHIGFLLHNRGDTEDLTQETFVQALRCIDRFAGRSSVSTWLHGIAINVVRGHIRKQGRKYRAYAGFEHVATLTRTTTDQPDHAHLRTRRARALLHAVDELSETLREAYVLLVLRELPRDEVALMLDVPAGTVSVRACRARAQVERTLRELGWFDDPGSESPPTANAPREAPAEPEKRADAVPKLSGPAMSDGQADTDASGDHT